MGHPEVLSMIWSENRFTLFRIMLFLGDAL